MKEKLRGMKSEIHVQDKDIQVVVQVVEMDKEEMASIHEEFGKVIVGAGN